MKHIKNWNKIFESDLPLEKYIKNQQDVIEDIFLEDIDQGICEVEKEEERYFLITYTFEKGEDFGDINGLKGYIKSLDVKKSLLERLEYNIKRLEQLGFEWKVETDVENEYLNFVVFYKKKEYTLTDAFGGEKRMSFVDDSVMKKVMKEKYGLHYINHRYEKATTGYYGKNDTFTLYFKGKITDENFEKIQKDLSQLKKIEEYTNGTQRELIPFRDYNIKLIRWDGSQMFAINIEISR
jgi:hypothetical protein